MAQQRLAAPAHASGRVGLREACGVTNGILQGAIALIVYRLIGVAFLRRGWIYLDLVWTLALLLCGVALLVV